MSSACLSACPKECAPCSPPFLCSFLRHQQVPAVRAGLAEPLVCPGVVVAHHFKAAVVFELFLVMC